MNSKTIKLSFVGDIMCKAIQNESCKEGVSYNYSGIFQQVCNELKSSDYLVGNLETPIAGEKLGYTSHMYSFNTPLQFAKELVSSGFHLVTTANNHCLDRGTQGLMNTIDSLDSIGLSHIGTYASKQDRDASFIVDIQGIRIAFLSYTYGTNAFVNHDYLMPEQKYMINLYQPQELLDGSIHLLQEMGQISAQVEELYITDNDLYKQSIRPYLKQLEEDILRYKSGNVDYTIMCMHSGGQYNVDPDSYTLQLADWMYDVGIDAIIGCHPHVVHPCEVRRGRPIAYSLGNFTTSLGINPLEQGTDSEYSIMLNLYLNKENQKTMLEKIGFSVLKTVMNPDKSSKVVLVYDLINQCSEPLEREKLIEQNQVIVNKFRGHEHSEIQPLKEYTLYY